MSVKEIVISVAPNGATKALHFDEFPLKFLGRMSLERASEIVFDDDSQTFRVEFIDWFAQWEEGRPPCSGFESYELAREFEVMLLQYIEHLGIRRMCHEDFKELSDHVRMFFDRGERTVALPEMRGDDQWWKQADRREALD